MSQILDIAQLLVACWTLSGKENKIPTSHGLLDRVLEAACNTNKLPEWACKELHFVDSRIGLQCVELPAILDWAQKAELTKAPNPSYKFAEIQVSEWVAKKLLKQLKVSEDNAIKWGRSLRASLDKEEKQPVCINIAGAEEY